MNDDARLSRPNTARGRMQRLVLQVQLEHEAAGELPTSGRFVPTRWKPRVWSASRPGVSPAPAAATTPASRKSRTRWLPVESRSLGGVLRAMTGEYLCSIAATNGQVGGFLHTEVSCTSETSTSKGTRSRRTRVVFWNTRRVGGSTGTGLRSPKSRLLNVATSILKKDHRFTTEPGGAREFEAWECEALGQGTIQRPVRAALDGLVPEPLSDVLEREAE